MVSRVALALSDGARHTRAALRKTTSFVHFSRAAVVVALRAVGLARLIVEFAAAALLALCCAIRILKSPSGTLRARGLTRRVLELPSFASHAMM